MATLTKEEFHQMHRQETFDHCIDLMQSLDELKDSCPDADTTLLRKELIVLMYDLQRETNKNGFDTLTRSTNYYGDAFFVTPDEIKKA